MSGIQTLGGNTFSVRRLLGLCFLLASSTHGEANQPRSTSPPAQTRCEALAQTVIPEAQIVEAQIQLAGRFEVAPGYKYPVPEFCRVRGVSRPSKDSRIGFELWLPTTTWNGRYYQYGQGAGGGDIFYKALIDSVNGGSAIGATDDGHTRDSTNSYQWAMGHPDKILDYGYRALEETRKIADIVLIQFYGVAPKHRYFEGCSGGGGAALMAARRMPDKWDGILVGDPDFDAIAFYVNSAWQARIWLMNPAGRIPPRKLPAIERAAVRSCGPQAHVVDGIVADPRFCRHDVAKLLCAGAESDECLTAAQVETLRGIYAGPRAPAPDASRFAGFPPTSESVSNAFDGWAWAITGGRTGSPGFYAPDEPFAVSYALNFFRNFLFDNPKWDLRTFEFDRDLTLADTKRVDGMTLREALSGDQQDVVPFLAAGGKMVVYTGWADAAVSPLSVIKYYEGIAGKIGGPSRLKQSLRLYLVPGMSHCLGGSGANSFGQIAAGALGNRAENNIARALESWVESGRAPDRIDAAKFVGDDPQKGVIFTRPICPFPAVPAYSGAGSSAFAENFQCVEDNDP